MTHEERIAVCKTCTNRRVSAKEGLLCDLTSQPPAFEGHCADYNEQAVATYADIPESVEELNLTADDIEYFKTQQNFTLAVAIGLISSILGAIIWAILTVATGYQIGFMALGVGALVGFAIQFTGKGVEQKFGYLGGALALLGCVLGNVIGVIVLTAQYIGVSYIDLINMVPLADLMSGVFETFGIMDLVFYGLAVAEGYKFSFRKISPAEIQQARR